jgi:ADP-ribosyl-[dinitrogen reductase] hydrolase
MHPVKNGGITHCRGGLGRAGLVAALLLIETGLEAEAAIRAVRAARPGAIETAAQERYVRAYSPSPPAARS